MTKKMIIFLVLIWVILLVMICLPKETTTSEYTSAQKSEDVVVISNPKTPAQKMRIVFKEELSIGEFEGDENYMFGSTIYFITDDEGNFYVSDYDNNRIQKYDPEGKYLLTIGREGQGPGEFQRLFVPRFDKDNNLYVPDLGNNRISFFDKNGQFLRQMKLKEDHYDLYINSKGFCLADKSSLSEEGNVQKTTIIYGLFDEQFNLVAELFKDEMEMQMPAGIDESSMVKFFGQAFSQIAFRHMTKYTLANNDFIYLGYSDKYEINIYSPEGKPMRKITRDYEPIPVTKKDKENFMEYINTSDEYSSPVFTEDLKNKALQEVKFPKYKPAYQSFFLMENGWLAVIVDSLRNEYMLFDIFDQEGRYIAHFKTTEIILPVETLTSERLFFFNNGKAYAVMEEEGYKFVKRYDIELQEYKGNKWVKSDINLNN